MTTLQRTSAQRLLARARKTRQAEQTPAPAEASALEASLEAVPAADVRAMLLEIAFVLHATRVVGLRSCGGAPGAGPRLLVEDAVVAAD